MNNKFNANNLKSLVPYFLLAVAVIIAFRVISEVGFYFSVIRHIFGIVAPFFYGFILAYILSIPRGGLEWLLKKSKVKFLVKHRRGFSILLVYLLLLLFVFLVLNLVIPAVVRSVALFIDNFPAHYANVMQFISQMELLGYSLDMDYISNAIQDWIQNFRFESVFDHIGTVIEASSAIFSGLFVLFLTLVSSIYILLEKDRFRAFLRRLIQAFTSARVYEAIAKHAESLNKNFKQYIRTQTFDGLILGTATTLWMMFMGSPYALLLGIMLGILNYIPYFGSIFGTIIAIVVIAFTQGLTTGIIVAVGLLVIQQLDANFIQPKLMGGSFSISPLLIIISITFGGAAAGIFGMIVAIPIVAVLKDVLEHAVQYHEAKSASVVSEEEKE
ncbi:MAG: AI-2E family transporter [Oscillospiraceae bacterium]|nr:AI-2E family transporter [Oscillospiraceae bacterium]